MSMGSGLTRGKDGGLLKDGKPYVVALETGDDTPVKVDERFDVDINKLVSNEMARQELLRVPGAQDFADLSDYPESRGDAERRLVELDRSLAPVVKSGEGYEDALRRVMQEAAKAPAVGRDSNAGKAGSEPGSAAESAGGASVAKPVSGGAGAESAPAKP